MSVLDFATLGLFGRALAGAGIGFVSPKAFVAARIGAVAPGAQRRAGARFGGAPKDEAREPAVAAFPRAF